MPVTTLVNPRPAPTYTTRQQLAPTVPKPAAVAPAPAPAARPALPTGSTVQTAGTAARPTTTVQTAAPAPAPAARPAATATATTATGARQQTGVTANGTPIYAPAPATTTRTAAPSSKAAVQQQIGQAQTVPAATSPTTTLSGGVSKEQLDFFARLGLVKDNGDGTYSMNGQTFTPNNASVGGTAINPATGQPYTPQETAANQGAYDAARASDLAWQQQHYPAMYAANQALTNPDGSRAGTWVPNPSNPSDDPNTWIWQPYVADPNWTNNGNMGEGPYSTTNNPTGPGIQGGTMQTQFGGVDMTQMGAAEQFNYDNSWRYSLPNADTEQGAWYAQNMGQLGQPGVGETAFNAAAPQLMNAGWGENQAARIAAQYQPGQYPTGTNFTEQALAGAQGAIPNALLQQPGAGENAYTSLAQKYGTSHPTGTNLTGAYAGAYDPQMLEQGIGERVGAEIGNTYRPGETPGVSNRADEFYQQFLSQMPDISADPGLEPYYANARRKASEDINRQMAARGMWGSSAAGDMIGEAMTNLGAEQANREAQYHLDRLAEQRGWQTTGGTLASSADSSSRGSAENERLWTGELADISRGAQELELSRAGENRQQTALGADIMRSADDVTGRLADQERSWADLLTGYGMDSQKLALDRGSQQLDWQSLFGNLSQNADQNSLAQSQNELDWVQGMGSLGLQADEAERARMAQLLSGANNAQQSMLERLGFGRDTAAQIDDAELRRLAAGQDAAASAQAAQRQRAQDYFQNTMAMGGAMEGVMSGQYNPMITEDKVLLDDILAMLTGSGAERLAGAQRTNAGAQQQQNSQQQMMMTLLMMGLL
jgi:hypothetical protein